MLAKIGKGGLPCVEQMDPSVLDDEMQHRCVLTLRQLLRQKWKLSLCWSHFAIPLGGCCIYLEHMKQNKSSTFVRGAEHSLQPACALCLA